MVNFRELNGPCDDTSSYALFGLESGTKQPAMLLVGSDDGVKVWQNGHPVWTNDVSRGALPFQDVVLLDLQPGGNDILVRVRNLTGESGLYLHYRALNPLVALLPQKVEPGSLSARLKEAAANPSGVKVDPRFLDVDWTVAAQQGNAERGRKLFGAMGLGCVKCHAITADATVNAGPSLAEAARRFNAPYLVESVLLPSKQVSPLFKATLVATSSGTVHTGLVIGETADKLELVLPDASRITIPTADVEERKLQDISPMPAGLVKTPEELRDLLAYLLSASPAAP
jgi:putative heme-binding domain-containing protein